MDNLEIYNSLRQVPQNAQKPIQAGRLKGMTDINPMWRIKALTEQFGPCGIGWRIEVIDKRIIDGSDGQKVAIVDALLYIKTDGEWSAPIPGTGGAMLVSNEKNGPYTSDEAFKMAYTDAISVCCKMLGVGADVYWQSDRDKYTSSKQPEPAIREEKPCICENCGKAIRDAKNTAGEIWKAKDIAVYTKLKYQKCLCIGCMNQAEKAEANAAGN